MFTDGSTSESSSSLGLFVPSLELVQSLKLSRRLSSTAAELHGIKKPLQHILQKWVIYSDSQAALQCLKKSLNKSTNPALISELLFIHATAANDGQHIVFQWVPGYSQTRL